MDRRKGKLFSLLLNILLYEILFQSLDYVSYAENIIVDEDYRLQKTCEKISMNTSHVFLEFSVASSLQCAGVCLLNTGCISFDVCGSEEDVLCRLRSQNVENACAAPLSPPSSCMNYEIYTPGQSQQISCQNFGTYNSGNGTCTCVFGCNGTLCEDCIADCEDGKIKGYTGSMLPTYIKPTGYEVAFQVVCDFLYGVSYFQRRTSGDLNFNRTWQEYNDGFGDINGEFWVGLKFLKPLSEVRNYELWFILHNGVMNKYYAYGNFTLTDEADGYRVFCEDIYDTDPNAFIPLNDTYSTSVYGQRFQTYDTDTYGCAALQNGGWWFNSNCSQSNMNGQLPVKWADADMFTTLLVLNPM